MDTAMAAATAVTKTTATTTTKTTVISLLLLLLLSLALAVSLVRAADAAGIEAEDLPPRREGAAATAALLRQQQKEGGGSWGAAAGTPWREKMSARRVMIGSTAPTCSYNECRGCRFKCRAEQVPVDANDPINSAYHYRCVCHRW